MNQFCEHCNIEFKQTRASQRFCKEKCQKNNWNLRLGNRKKRMRNHLLRASHADDKTLLETR